MKNSCKHAPLGPSRQGGSSLGNGLTTQQWSQSLCSARQSLIPFNIPSDACDHIGSFNAMLRAVRHQQGEILNYVTTTKKDCHEFCCVEVEHTIHPKKSEYTQDHSFQLFSFFSLLLALNHLSFEFTHHFSEKRILAHNSIRQKQNSAQIIRNT